MPLTPLRISSLHQRRGRGDLPVCVAAGLPGPDGVAMLALLVHELGAAPFLRRPMDGRTPLHVAAALGNEGVVGLLLSLPATQADLDCRDYDGCTAADLAAAAGHVGLAARLATAVAQASPGLA
jgi:hypothetical protein